MLMSDTLFRDEVSRFEKENLILTYNNTLDAHSQHKTSFYQALEGGGGKERENGCCDVAPQCRPTFRPKRQRQMSSSFVFPDFYNLPPFFT